MLGFGVEKILRDASLFLHRDATVGVSRFKIVKAMLPETAGKYAGAEN
jgi:acyl-CoA dehydrogenase